MGTDLDYLAHLASESARFAAVIGGLPRAARVPSCPDWNADDLLWHLGEVQWFWGTIVREKVTGAQAEQLKPGRPAGRAGLLAFYQRASRDLQEILAETAPQAPAWTWSDDQTAGFIRRRQAHEALIHRVDAELAAGSRSPMGPRLSADGVDEALRIMYGGDVPGWGTFTPGSAKALRLLATDTGDSWLVTLGRFTGTDPGDQASYDEPGIRAAGSDPGGPAAALIGGTAADLDCWLWHRPPVAPIDRSGDQELLSRFDSVIAPGVT
ncbi:MAG TPA: maleylpyruvate isomerase family mycothiol-dependent enzyme [Streptosporangiaceae bacterium]